MENTTRFPFRNRRTSLRTAAIVWCVCVALHANANIHCIELIRNSRTIAVTIQDESELSAIVRDYCNEYQRSRNENRSASYGASYKLLSLSMDTDNTNEEEIASKYCRYDSTTTSNARHFKQYLSGIAPGAYAAYLACVNSKEVSYRVLSPPTPTTLELVVEFNSDDSNAATELSWSSPSVPVVNCAWETAPESSAREITLAADTKTRLICTRTDPQSEPRLQPDHINVVRIGGGAGDISIPWQKYNEDSEPISTLGEVSRQVNSQVERVQGTINNLAAENANLRESVQNMSARLESFLNRRWNDVTGIRRENTCYVNNTQFPIELAISSSIHGTTGPNFCRVAVLAGDGHFLLADMVNNNSKFYKGCAITATIPPGETYRVDPNGFRDGHIHMWRELRVGDGSVDQVQCP